MSLEELLSLEVTTASRKATNLSDTAAAVFVITREDIRRSGHTSIPELLRMVPGMHVARINSSAWAVGSRGANGHFNDKLLVMIDGRSVYTNLFSGVFWDEPDVLLEDVDRIEVIRGPGGAIWGANAVSGVINIITRSAADTHGAYATALAGDEERGTAAYRYGDVYGENFHWRVFAKWFERDATHSLMGGDSPDGWHYRRAGFRADWDKSDRDTFSFQGAWYSGHEREIDPLVMPTPPYDAASSPRTTASVAAGASSEADAQEQGEDRCSVGAHGGSLSRRHGTIADSPRARNRAAPLLTWRCATS